MANLFWISAADLVKRLGDGPHTAASLLSAYAWTFTRADASTCASYIDKTGVLQTAVAGSLRVQYEDLDGDGIRETPGILLEGSRTNSCLRSEELDNAAWTKTNVTVTANATTAPDGATTMDKVVETAVSATHIIGQSITITAGEFVAATFHLKGAERTEVRCRVSPNGVDEFYATVDLSAGTITASGVAGAGTLTLAKITAFPNSEYRLQITGKCNAGSVTASGDIILRASGSESYLGDITKGLYAWGIQLERCGTTGGFPSSYIKTVASAVTRAADSLTLPVNFGPFDTTVLTRIARPVWADAAGDIGLPPSAFQVGDSATPNFRGGGVQASRNWYGFIDTTGSDSNASSAILAGATQNISRQYKNLTTGGQVAVDVGGGLGAFASAATAFSAFGNQTLAVGRANVGQELYGVLIELKGRQGLITLAAILTEPSFAPSNPFEVSDFEVPGPLISKAASGRVNLRSTQQIGRTWTERYLLQTTSTTHKEFLARMSTYWRNGTIFPKGHVDYATPKGSGGGFPLVKGASQTGSTLIVDGCPLNTANWLRAGDIFRVQGLAQAFMVAADVNTEGDGRALIPLVIPIFTGGSPVDNATLTITGVTLDVVILEPPSFPTTSATGADWGELSIRLSEAL